MNFPWRRALPLCRAVTLFALIVRGSFVSGQPSLDQLPARLRGPDAVARLFDRGSGLSAGTVFALSRDANGRVWLGTDDGVFVSAGGQWKQAEMPKVDSRQVREILFDSVGGLWYATRVGAFVQRRGTWHAFTEKEGVPGSVVYSLAETRAIDGTRRVVLGASNGVCVVQQARCEPLSLPPGIGSISYMVRATVSGTGTPELWVASANGGAARLRSGRWTVFTAAEGLRTLSAEDVVLGPPSVPEPVVIVGRDGVFSLRATPQGGERFERMLGSPQIAYRGMWVVPPTAGPELWVGTADGYVLRARRGRWDTLPVPDAIRHGQVTVMKAVQDSDVTRAVYIGTRGDRLIRFTFGPATTYALPGSATRDFVAEIADAPPAFADSMRSRATMLISAGAVSLIDSVGRPRSLESATAPRAVSNTSGYFGPLAPTSSVASVRVEQPFATLVGTARGILQFDGSSWREMPGAPILLSRDIRRVELPDGTQAVVAATSLGLKWWTGTSWEALAGAPTVDVAAVHSVRTVDGVQLLIGAKGGVYTQRARTLQFDSIPVQSGNPANWFQSFCSLPSGGRMRIFAGTDHGEAFWRDADSISAWHALPQQIARTISPVVRVPVSCAVRERVLFGSGFGLSVVDVAAKDPASWRLIALLGREDGLAANEVSTVGAVTNDRVWVGTVFGPSLVDLSLIRSSLPAPLEVRVYDDPRGPPLVDGVHLPASRGQLRVEYWIDNAHREEDSRFLVDWRRDDGWFSSADSAVGDNAAWSDATTRFITGISPGTYTLRVRGRDFAGREPAAVEFTIVIDPPWWRAWPALLSYLFAIVTVLISLYRWRVGVLRSGTQQLVESERRLRASEGKFRALFDRAMDAHVLVEGGVVVGANAMAAHLFGELAGESLLGRSLRELLPADADATPGRLAQDVVLRRAGEPLPAQMSVTSITTDSGPMLHVVLRDLTEVRAAERARERMEAHLRERQRLESLGTLAGGVAHDFNNLLGVIRGNAELADDELDAQSTAHEHLVSIVDASDRARDLVRQILTFSRNPTPRKERVDLSALLRSLQPLLRRMIPSSVDIVLIGAETPHMVQGDPTQLEQVLLNLASNAEYAMRAHASGRLVMAIAESQQPREGPPPHGRAVHLEVRDTGDGMSDEVREHVFEPFFTTKPTGEGTGLGLAVIHGIVEAHGGRVQLSSAVGEGTSVEVLLPAVDSVSDVSASSSPTARDVTANPAGLGGRLVVVDDEPSVARVLERSLARGGYSVRVFSDPVVALEAITLAPDNVDLLLTDQTMPGLTGDVLTERVHQVAPGLPVLILTGFSHRLTSERAEAVGAHAVLQKPIALQELHRAVESALSMSASSGERHRRP